MVYHQNITKQTTLLPQNAENVWRNQIFDGFPCQFYMGFSFYYMCVHYCEVYLHRNSLGAKCNCPILTGGHYFWALLRGCLMKVFLKSNHSNLNCLLLWGICYLACSLSGRFTVSYYLLKNSFGITTKIRF